MGRLVGVAKDLKGYTYGINGALLEREPLTIGCPYWQGGVDTVADEGEVGQDKSKKTTCPECGHVW